MVKWREHEVESEGYGRNSEEDLDYMKRKYEKKS